MTPVWDLSPPNQKEEYYFYYMGKATDTYQQTYDKLLLAGDFNAENTEHVCYNACLSMMLLTL